MILAKIFCDLPNNEVENLWKKNSGKKWSLASLHCLSTQTRKKMHFAGFLIPGPTGRPDGPWTSLEILKKKSLQMPQKT